MRKLHTLEDLQSARKRLRNAATPAEATLWRALQRSQLKGRKFRRQQSIGPYIVDFYCPSEKLIVELDGAAHESPEAISRDAERTACLRSLGFEILRIENRDVFESPEGVVALITQRFKNDF